MKSTIKIIIILIFITTSTSFSIKLIDNDFHLFKAKFNKRYATNAEETYRMNVFHQNVKFIKQHNLRYQAKLESYQLGINHFADLPLQQYKAIYLNALEKDKSFTKQCKGPQPPMENIPQSVNWVEHGAVTPIKNQGVCSAGYAFGATGALQGAYYQQTGTLLSFSEQQIVDCSWNFNNEGCKGGNVQWSMWYVIDHGITTQTQYKYKGEDQDCSYNQTKQKVWQIKDCTLVLQGSQKALKASIAKTPVAVFVDAGNQSFQYYVKGIYTGKCGTRPDHGLVATGYSNQNGKGYFILKNSWSNIWGNKGYIWMAQIGDGKGLCGMYLDSVFPIPE